jgi:hypothetical protein
MKTQDIEIGLRGRPAPLKSVIVATSLSIGAVLELCHLGVDVGNEPSNVIGHAAQARPRRRPTKEDDARLARELFTDSKHFIRESRNSALIQLDHDSRRSPSLALIVRD